MITATRNRTDLLERALRSIASQELADYEAVVVDDGSDEATQRYHDALFDTLPNNFQLHRVRPPGSEGAGPGGARNQGIRRARGTFVAFLDDDDFWMRTDHHSAAATNMHAQGTDYFFAKMQGKRQGEVVIPDGFAHSPSLTSGRQVNQAPSVHEVPLTSFLCAMHHHYSHPNCWVVHREIFCKLGGFWEKVSLGEDYELMLRIADCATRILYRPNSVTSYRLPEGNSVSLTLSWLDEHIQRVACSVHTRATSKRPQVRRCARARESKHMRKVAERLIREIQPAAAISFAWQAFATYPTLGGLMLTLKALGGSRWWAPPRAVSPACVPPPQQALVVSEENP